MTPSFFAAQNKDVGDSRSISSRRPRDPHEWRARKFLFISLIVTTVSIIFFVAIKALSPTIKEGAAEWQDKLNPFVQRVIDWGGINVQSISVNVLAGEGAHATDRRLFFESSSSLKKMKEELNAYIGEPFWLVNLETIKLRILDSGWAKEVSIRRSFPYSLEVGILPRNPRFLLKVGPAWMIADGEAMVMSVTEGVPGPFADLPLVFGFGSRWSPSMKVTEINRQAESDRKALIDLSDLIEALESRLKVKVESVSAVWDQWLEQYIFTFSWIEKDSEREIRVSLIQTEDRDRLSALQVVLSELPQTSAQKWDVRGEFGGRWIVKSEGVN